MPRDRSAQRTRVQTQGPHVCLTGKELPNVESGIKDPLSLDETNLQNTSNHYLAIVTSITDLFITFITKHLGGVLTGQATSDKRTEAREDPGCACEGSVCYAATAGGSGNSRKWLNTLPFGSDCGGGAWKEEACKGEGSLGKSSQIFVDNLDLTALGYSPISANQCKGLWRETQCGRGRAEIPNECSFHHQPT